MIKHSEEFKREGEAAQLIRGISENRTDILKNGARDMGSSSRAYGREVRVCGELAPSLAGGDDLPGDAGEPSRLSFLAITTDESAE